MTTQEPSENMPRLVELLQCAKQRCGHVLTYDEHVWVQTDGYEHNCKTGTCPKCGNDSFYHLNAMGKIRLSSDESPRKINPNDISPSPRMGLKMKRRILAAKRRALQP